MRNIPFARPVHLGGEADRFARVLAAPSCGAHPFTLRCEQLLSSILGKRALLVSSATHALEMAAVLLELGAGDEVIMPSYTISSTANAFLLRGARPVFADIDESGNLDPADVERVLSARTRAVVPVHYGGFCCDLDELRVVSRGLPIIEDAAQALGASFHGRPLGTFGACAAISFHETKNVGCGEGGALVVGEESLVARAEVLRDKGTNRALFESGSVDRYTWIDLGSSYTIGEANAAWLSVQLEQLDLIQGRRQAIVDRYRSELEEPVGRYGATILNGRGGSVGNAHLFAIVFRTAEQRAKYITHMRERGICCAFHYTALHTSPMGRKLHDGRPLPGAERLSTCLVRLPLYQDMTEEDAGRVIGTTLEFLRR